MSSTRYFITRDHDGSIALLVRILQDDSGLWGESLEDGQWIEYPVLTDVLIDPLFGEEISEVEARAIAEKMHGNI